MNNKNVSYFYYRSEIGENIFVHYIQLVVRMHHYSKCLLVFNSDWIDGRFQFLHINCIPKKDVNEI